MWARRSDRAWSWVAVVLITAGARRPPRSSSTMRPGSRTEGRRAQHGPEGFDREWGRRQCARPHRAHAATGGLAARNATFKNDPLKPAEIERGDKQEPARTCGGPLRGRSETSRGLSAPLLRAPANKAASCRTTTAQRKGRRAPTALRGGFLPDLKGRDRSVAVADPTDAT